MTWAEFLAKHSWEMGLLVVMLACSGFCSGSETALFNLSRGQLHKLRNAGAAGRIVASLMGSPRRVLNTLLLANMIVNTVFAAVTAVIILDLGLLGVPPWAAGLLSVVPLLVLILLGEVAPKMLGLVLGERWATLAAVPLMVLGQVLSPVMRLLDALIVVPLTRLLAPRPAAGTDITAEEMGAVLALSAKRGIIGHDAGELLREIVALTDLRVRDIMIPRVDVIAYDVDAPPAGLMELFRRSRLKKVPVYERDLDGVLGVVYARKLLLTPTSPLRQLVVKVPFVPEAANVERVLVQFRVTRTKLAFVVDEYGGTAGLVTLQDILEEIVGDIPGPDEAGQAPAVQRVSDRQYLLDGHLAAHEWADAFRMDLSGRRISTVGGFVTSLLGRIPRVGDEVSYRNLRFRVESMRGRRIDKLRLDLPEGS
jgi:CBS domain containing-hemolysin-like protein